MALTKPFVYSTLLKWACSVDAVKRTVGPAALRCEENGGTAVLIHTVEAGLQR